MLPTMQIDLYKAFMGRALHPDVTETYANYINRSGNYCPDNKLGGVVSVGMQAFIKDYLMNEFNTEFFDLDRDTAVAMHRTVLSAMLGYEVSVDHLEALHDLGYLPLRVKTVPEGTIVPYGVPTFTLASTKEGFEWLTTSLETVTSCENWGISTSATTAANYRLNFLRAAVKTGIDPSFVMFQGHDFSMRGMMGRHAAASSGFGHLCSFAGTDTVPAVLFAMKYYNANIDTELIGAGVNATEHSVTCSWQNEGELAFYRHLMHEVAPTGILSLVFDTWDFWGGVADILPTLKEEILARDGQIVIRPDSGDPVKILCGDPVARNENVRKGLVECLWDIFGGTTTPEGYKMLDSHIGAIYGDSITIERQLQIQKLLMAKGFAPSVVLGIGSFTYQMVTRDTHGSAVKTTSVVKNGVREAVFKAPKTDPGKKSAKGLLMVKRVDGVITLFNDVTEAEERTGMLETVFLDGKVVKETSLATIRARINKQLKELM